VENKSHNLFEKLSVVEKEREDLSRRFVDEREGTKRARVEAQAARTEADATCAEADLTLKCAIDKES
jgi:hypothetical protein